MTDRIFGDREKAMEDAFFRERDAKLLDKLRRRAHLDEVAEALGEKLHLDNPDLLLKVKELGVTLETAPGFFLAPLVQVAWAEGKITKGEHDAVLRIARERGIAPGSASYVELEGWLRERPSDEFFDTAVEVIKAGFEVLPPDEREARTREVVDACQEVAEASAGLARLFGISEAVRPAEALTLDDINRHLRSRD